MDSIIPAPTPTIAFEFNGKAWEYFRIWIVNVCLTIITLGIYSPWAKVRQRRYFYGSTRLAGASFDYVAKPWNILKGRVLALGVLVMFGVVNHFWPIFIFLFSLAFIVALPWLIIRTLRFNYFNTVYRNLRLGFKADYLDALVVFIILPLVAVINLGLAFPWVASQQKKFFVNNSNYGNSHFKVDLTAGDFWTIIFNLFFYIIFFVAIIYSLNGLIGYFGPHVELSYIKSLVQSITEEDQNKILSFATSFGALLFYGFVILFIKLYMEVAIFNLIWNNTQISDIRFQSRLEFSQMFGMYLTNILAIIFSFGLLIPWAKIRVVRYRLESLSVISSPDQLESFAVGQGQAVGAFGEEISDFLDMDIGM